MNLFELVQTALTSLTSNKGRTALTMLGIIIGISSVISMLAIGSASQKSIETSVTALGSNLLTITSGAQRTGLVQGGQGSNLNLTMEDYKAIKSDQVLSSQISGISPEYSSNSQIIAGKNNTNVSVTGVEPEYFGVHNYQIENGEQITTQQNLETQKIAVLAPDTATNLFADQDPIGQTIKINKIAFRVIGITKKKGSSGFQNPDDAVFIPLSAAQKIIFGQNKLRSIVVQAKDPESLASLQIQLTDLLNSRHKITGTKQSDFSIRNSADTLSTLSSITGVFTTLLASVGGISLLVGGIGIMNIMIVTVTERTREIGLRKAVGARNKTVLNQFLVEAIILTLLGGLLGVLLGYLITFGLTQLNIVAAQIELSSILLAVGISVTIGVVFGLYPAYKASKLSPIDALKFE
jgi:putative ABC transport system permease protein